MAPPRLSILDLPLIHIMWSRETTSHLKVRNLQLNVRYRNCVVDKRVINVVIIVSEECIYPFMFLLVSTHVVCERLSVMQGLPQYGMANLCSKFLECPYSSISGMLVWTTTLPQKKKIWADLGTLDLSWSRAAPTPNEKLGRSWHFGFELVWSTPLPPKMKIWADLGTLYLSWSGVPPPSQKWKFGS